MRTSMLKPYNLIIALFFILFNLDQVKSFTQNGITIQDLVYNNAGDLAYEASSWGLTSMRGSSKIYYCDGIWMLGGYSVLGGGDQRGQYYQRIYYNLPRHTQISVQMTILVLDSWDDETFQISFDGDVKNTWNFDFSDASTNRCGSGWDDHYPITININYPHSSRSLIFRVISQLDENSENESLGFRAITMSFDYVPYPSYSICSTYNYPLCCASPSQYYSGGWCYSCYSTCKSCNGPYSTNCLTCPAGRYLSGGQCLPCSYNCAACSGAGESDCVLCTSTYPYMARETICIAACSDPLQVSSSYGIATCVTPCPNSPNNYVLWDGSCESDCSSKRLVAETHYTFQFCIYKCTAGQYLYWDSECDNSCDYPASIRDFKGKPYCDHWTCTSSQSLYWDQACEDKCSFPLTEKMVHGRSFCQYPCQNNEYLYWDKYCGSTCYFPQIIRIWHGKQFCDFPCSASQYLYWNNTCISTCDPPLKTRQERSVKYCDYPCSGTQYLYWNGSCLSSCDLPLKTRGSGSSRFCDYPCQPSEILHWSGTCVTSCSIPPISTIIEGDTIKRNYCRYPCAQTQYLYWNGTCADTCAQRLVREVISSRNFCKYNCGANQYLYWSGTCKDSCLSPLDTRVESGKNYCDYRCQASEYLYWNRSCKTSCGLPLASENVEGSKLCKYNCDASNQYLYWDGSCKSSCNFPLRTRTDVEGLRYCEYPCQASEFLYWNGSCIATCNFTTRLEESNTKKYCDFTCSTSTDYLYWDKTCSSSCDYPLTSYTEGNTIIRNFCSFPCADSSQYLYWDQTCQSTCNSPLTSTQQRGRKFCNQPCSNIDDYFYWNGSCKASCVAPLKIRQQNERKFCDYPCADSEYLLWNGTCWPSCNIPFQSRNIFGSKFCDYPCADTSMYLYWDGSCEAACDAPRTPVTEGDPISRKYCKYQCNSNEFLYWDSKCYSTCPSPLTQSQEKQKAFCSYKCSGNEYLYWDSTCLAFCNAPLTPRVDLFGKNYCDYKCTGSDVLYWDNSCRSACNSPLTSRSYKNQKFCDFKCSDNEYLYWNGSCKASCDIPLPSREDGTKKFCEYPCTGSDSLFWNGTCLPTSTCLSPLVKRQENIGEDYCDYKCKVTEYLYWNGRCSSTCDFPLIKWVAADRQYCNYPCPTNKYLYWNGTCQDSCDLPLTPRIDGDDKYCDFGCSPDDVLYWDGSCDTICELPRMLITEGDSIIRKFCLYPCNNNRYLYWDQTCVESCESPLLSKEYNNKQFCEFPCATDEFSNWDGTCLSACLLPYSSRSYHSRKFCAYPCQSSQYLFWNGSCLSSCDFPLQQSTSHGYQFCKFPCESEEYLYWDGTCSSLCPLPLSEVIEGEIKFRKYCRFGCESADDFLYWNRSCKSSCPTPFTSQEVNQRKICQFPCDGNNYVYWDGSCLSSCEAPLTPRIELGLKYCEHSCLSNHYLYWNGSCLPRCASTYSPRAYKDVLFCDFPCSGSQYLYPNSSCSSECPFPFHQRVDEVVETVKFCDYPCSANQFVAWNGSCITNCQLPFVAQISTGGHFCDLPCGSSSNSYYYPDLKKCVNGCKSPYQPNSSEPYLQCMAQTVNTSTTTTIEKSDPLLTDTPIFNSFFIAPVGNGTITVVKVVKVMNYVRFLKFPLPPRLERLGASQGRSILSFQSNSRILEKSGATELMRSTLPNFFARSDLDETFVVNYWGTFIFLICTTGGVVIFTILEFLSKKSNFILIEAIFKRFKVIVRWNLCVMVLMTSIDDIVLYSSIEFRSLGSETSSANKFSLALAIIFSLLAMNVLIGIFLLVKKYRKLKETSTVLAVRDFECKWQELQVTFRGFRDNNKLNQYFFLIYVARIGIPMLITVAATEAPLFVTIVQVITSVVITAYLLIMKPFKKRINQIQMLIFEIVVLMMNICMLILTIFYVSDRNGGDSSIVLGDIVIFGNTILNLMTPVFLVIRLILEGRAIWLYNKTLKTTGSIKNTRYIKLIGLVFQQANMGFEEMIEDHTTQSSVIPLSKTLVKDLDVSKRGLFSQNGHDTTFLKTDLKKNDIWISDTAQGGFARKLSDSANLRRSRANTADYDINDSGMIKSQDLQKKKSTELMVEDLNPGHSINASNLTNSKIFAFEESTVTIKEDKIEVSKDHLDDDLLANSKPGSATLKLNKSKKTKAITDSYQPEQSSEINMHDDQQKPLKSPTIVFKTHSKPKPTRAKFSGTGKAMKFLNYDWKEVPVESPSKLIHILNDEDLQAYSIDLDSPSSQHSPSISLNNSPSVGPRSNSFEKQVDDKSHTSIGSPQMSQTNSLKRLARHKSFGRKKEIDLNSSETKNK